MIEVLVVIAVISILAALLLPTLSSAKERSRRTNCLNNIRQFYLAAQMYADDHDLWLPSGASDSNNPDGVLDDSVPVISRQTRTQLVYYAGSPKIFGCPSLGAPFNSDQGWYEEGYGYVLGYNYLGGHTNTPWPVLPGGEPWVSPQRIDGGVEIDPTSPLITDANDWSPGYGRSVAPHCRAGPANLAGDFSNETAAGASSDQLGAAGGNIGCLDGSAAWKPISQMRLRRGSQKWDSDGCWAMW